MRRDARSGRERRLLTRERLSRVLPQLWGARLCLLVAPAGSGKTTLLAQLEAAAGGPIVCHMAESTDGDAWTLLERLERLLARSLRGPYGRGRTPEELAEALSAGLEHRTVLAFDDFHVLDGTAGEQAVERLVRHAPPLLSFVIAARTRPNFNLSRLRANGDLLEIGPDDLRFRSWEVERLFHDIYREPLPPEALAALTRRTEGWAAGLQLFHLATHGKPSNERQKVLASLGTRSDLVREYLTRNVLDELPAELRRFLLDTCVLTRLSGSLCDAFLGRTGSEDVLDELERRQVFTQAFRDGTYRYHEVLRGHLEAVFVAETGEAEARVRYRRAAELLEAEGALPDAVRAYCRAEAWSEIGRLLGHGGERALMDRGEWLSELPRAIIRDDPWLLLAAARAERAAGRCEKATSLYRDAERLFSLGPASETCLEERRALRSWIDASVAPSNDALGLIRAATVREPLAARRRAATMPGSAARLALGVSALLAGYAGEAAGALAAAVDDPDVGPECAAAARIALAAALILSGDERGAMEAEWASEEADRAGSPFLVRLSRAVLALDGNANGTLEATASRVMSEAEGDRWGSLVATLLEAWGMLRLDQDAVALFEEAADLARSLAAGVFEAWARAGLALAEARAEHPEARAFALQAEVAARLVGAKGAQGLAYLALARSEPAAASEYSALAHAVEDECAIVLPVVAATPQPPRLPPVELFCFGGFSLVVGGKSVDLSAVKPRARRALRCLALHPGQPVHREVLIEALWPGGNAVRATRHLHVLISTLRRILEPAMERSGSQLILRDGEAYCVTLPAGARADVVEFDDALAQGRSAQAEGRDDDAIAYFQRVMNLYAGDLLPEEGPADWIIDERELRRSQLCEAAVALAEMLLARGEALSAAVVCERAIRVNRYEDSLWRTCATAYEQAGDAAAAEQVRRRYQSVLAELGLQPVPA